MARTSRTTQVTTDHATIRAWAEERGAKPARVKGTARGLGDPGVIRLDVSGDGGEGSLEELSWDEWFEKFDESNLAFLYQERAKDGQLSHFNKLVSRDRDDDRVRDDED